LILNGHPMLSAYSRSDARPKKVRIAAPNRQI